MSIEITQKEEKRETVLPSSGIISIPNLARFAQMDEWVLAQRLREKGIPIIRLGNFMTHKFVRLEDLAVPNLIEDTSVFSRPQKPKVEPHDRG
jgi:hypothetical protein